MYPEKFDYYRAGSVAEALTLLGEHPEAKLLAGGHSLLPMMKLRLTHPGAVIDIGRVAELAGIAAAVPPTASGIPGLCERRTIAPAGARAGRRPAWSLPSNRAARPGGCRLGGFDPAARDPRPSRIDARGPRSSR